MWKTNKRWIIVDFGASQHIRNDSSIFVNVGDIDPVSVPLADGTVLLAKKHPSVCMDLSLPCDSDEAVACLTVRNMLYTHETSMSMISGILYSWIM